MALPEDAYEQRRRAHEAQRARLERQYSRIGRLRLLVAAAAIVVAWCSLRRQWFSSLWLLLPLATFAALVLQHHRVRNARRRSERAARFYHRGLDRIRDQWAGGGQQGERFADAAHVYSADLDLFGHGSLFELLCEARTRMGEATLAGWLLTPASLATIRDRWDSVRDLRDRLQLREDLAVLGDRAAAGVHPEALLRWAREPNRLGSLWIRAAALLLPCLAVTSAWLWYRSGSAAPFLLVISGEALLLFHLRQSIDQVLYGTERAFEDLPLFASIITRIEREPFAAVPLQQLIGRLAAGAARVPDRLARLGAIANFAGSRRNQLIATLAIPLVYGLLVALAAERWRRIHGAAVAVWAQVVGECEALLAIAAYSFEHPADPFPEIVEGPASFQGVGLGHPLIPAARCVRNDVALAGATRMLIVSGSNMSGKSTLLRVVGTNTILAMMGAPVRAQHLRLAPLQLGASIRINDSLQEGRSRFYAEILRIRQLLELASAGLPLLALLDELLQGTNSQDRRVGAAGVVRALVRLGAIGLLSTHDLALTELACAQDSLRNVHFQDEILDGRMSFDFRLHDGVLTRSNGVALMRLIGLEV